MRRKDKRKKNFSSLVTTMNRKNEDSFIYQEAYKSLRTNIRFLSSNEKAKSFVLTSAVQQEGKSSVAINLAITLAEEGKKVVLLDCNFRTPAMHQYIRGFYYGKGLTDVLMETCRINDVLYRINEWQVDLLPAGTIPSNPTELLLSAQMRQVLEILHQKYDYILIDAPSIALFTDAAIIGGMVEGALLVVRSDYTPVNLVQVAKKKLEDVNVKIFGVILSRYAKKSVEEQVAYY